MPNQPASASRLFGGAAARKDLRFIVIFTAVLSSIGIADLLFRSSGGVVFIVVALLAIVGLYVLWRRWKRSLSGSARLHQHRSRVSRTRIGFLILSHPSLGNSLVIVLLYIAALCLAGVGVTGGTLATVILVSFAVLSAVAAFAVFQIRQRARTEGDQALPGE